MGTSLNLTVYDFIVHLIPGGVLITGLILLNKLDLKSLNYSNELMLIAFLFASYFVGQLLQNIGNILFNSFYHPKDYENKRLRQAFIRFLHQRIKKIIRQDYKSNGFQFKTELVKIINRKMFLNIQETDTVALFQVCDVIVQRMNFTERDIHYAREGFFRSSSVIYLILAVNCAVIYGWSITTAVAFIIAATLVRLMIHGHTYYGSLRRNQTMTLAYLKLRGLDQ